jgi:hypothetical protein
MVSTPGEKFRRTSTVRTIRCLGLNTSHHIFYQERKRLAHPQSDLKGVKLDITKTEVLPADIQRKKRTPDNLFKPLTNKKSNLYRREARGASPTTNHYSSIYPPNYILPTTALYPTKEKKSKYDVAFCNV